MEVSPSDGPQLLEGNKDGVEYDTEITDGLVTQNKFNHLFEWEVQFTALDGTGSIRAWLNTKNAAKLLTALGADDRKHSVEEIQGRRIGITVVERPRRDGTGTTTRVDPTRFYNLPQVAADTEVPW